MKKKGLLIKTLALLVFRSRGGILNTFDSLISPKEYKIKTSLELEKIVNELLELLAPYPSKSPLRLIGSQGDGGYLMANFDIKQAQFLISGGIETNNEFEYELAELGIEGLQIDNSINYPPKVHKNLKFIRATLGLGENQSFSIDAYLDSVEHKNILLKLDIEGAELEVINGIKIHNLEKVHSAVIELHDLDYLFLNEYREKLLETLNHLKEAGLVPCFISPNNVTSAEIIGGILIPRNIEITFTRRNRVKSKFSMKDFEPIIKKQKKNINGISSININHIILRRVVNNV